MESRFFYLSYIHIPKIIFIFNEWYMFILYYYQSVFTLYQFNKFLCISLPIES